MGFLDNFTRLFTRDSGSGDTSPVVIPSRSIPASSVTTGDALGLAMVYRAVSIHTVAAKQLSYDAYRNSVVLTTDQAPTWLKRPDINSTKSAFIEQTVVSMACTGNAYWLITRNDRGVSNLEVLNPLDVLIHTDARGNVAKFSYQGRDYSPNDIQHLQLLRVPGTPYGLGPIQAAQAELRGAIDTRDYAGNWFTGSGVPVGGYLGTDQSLNPELAQQTRDAWTAATANREGVPVLGNGVKFVQTFLTPADAMWLDAQKFNVTQAARLFGVPASLMLASSEGSPQTYQNVSQEWIGYVRFSLMQYLIEIEDAFSQLLPRGTEAHFNVEALLRSDTLTRYQTYQLATGDKPWLLPSEVRAIEGYPSLAGVDDAPTPPKDTTP